MRHASCGKLEFDVGERVCWDRMANGTIIDRATDIWTLNLHMAVDERAFEGIYSAHGTASYNHARRVCSTGATTVEVTKKRSGPNGDVYGFRLISGEM